MADAVDPIAPAPAGDQLAEAAARVTRVVHEDSERYVVDRVTLALHALHHGGHARARHDLALAVRALAQIDKRTATGIARLDRPTISAARRRGRGAAA